jgi:hypothetical protein|tara:strand:+ start:544 stop:654 length:111 start_codon:yes stop_codon:yes gene_type:complete
MTIQEVIEQLQCEEDKALLHELAWQLVNLTRPEEQE